MLCSMFCARTSNVPSLTTLTTLMPAAALKQLTMSCYDSTTPLCHPQTQLQP